MLSKLRIGTKVILLVLVITVVTVITETIISQARTKRTLERDSFKKLELISNVYESRLQSYFSSINKQLNILAEEDEFVMAFDSLNKIIQDESFNDGILGNALYGRQSYWVKRLRNKILRPIQNENDFEDIYLLGGDGKQILYQNISSEQLGEDFRNLDNEIVDLHKPNFYVNHPTYENKQFYVYVSYPVMSVGTQEGHIMCKISLDKIISDITLSNLIEPNSKLFIDLYKQHKRELFLLGEYNQDGEFQQKKVLEKNQEIVDNILRQSEQDASDDFDIDDEGYLKHGAYNQLLDLVIITKVSKNKVFENLGEYTLITVLAGAVILLLALVLSLIFVKYLTLPMLKLKKVLGLVSNGVLPKELHTPLKDEVGEMIVIVNKIVSSLKNTAAFAHKIGEGNFDTEYKPLSNKDILGHALVNMSESLQTADQKDALRNWIVTGVAEIGEILRSNDRIDKLGDEILNYLCKRIDAAQGAFYTVFNYDNQDALDQVLVMKSSYAYGKKKFLKGSYRFAEGLVGQAAVERDIILRTEIPDNYMSISSGLLGEKRPKCLMIVPLITNEQVYGVLELAGFKKFVPGDVQFIEEVSVIIARTIFNINVNDRTKRLLEESQRMSSELQTHQQELQQNAIAMERTQEELKESNQNLEVQIRNVNNAQNRMHTLLVNASEVVTIYEDDNTIRYISPSVERILGYSQEDLIGINDIKYVDEKEQEVVKEMFERLLGGEKKVTIQMSYYRKTGDKIWLEATGENKIDDPAINGIVVNSRDITEKLRAEREERKRGQMQALSENSPDLITRISSNGTFFYINPVIERLTGMSPDEFINQKITEIKLNEEVKETWGEILEKVITDREKHFMEMNFPSSIGNRIMAVDAIPEGDIEKDEIESVLIVSHDVTEQKEIENEIISKNRKINDSINYAERIQEAILPDSVIMDQTFEQSFIYYKPRDVVSGDFPWFMKKGDDIFISAVDCTGHGVPGALISIVGFFLLNDIVGSRNISTPGEILDNLDKLVTSTFRQDQESSKIKDGMDVAFCKINKQKGEVEFAGAHRPLYVLRASGEIEEFKPNKFPIGGGNAYTNKTNFTNHVVKVDKGDSIHFFSDGFPDQFGGATNRKFGPKRIKEILQSKVGQDMSVIEAEFDKQFVEWKGEGKQTDDVLLIGIAF